MCVGCRKLNFHLSFETGLIFEFGAMTKFRDGINVAVYITPTKPNGFQNFYWSLIKLGLSI